MEEFGKVKLDWLRKFAPFANGVPPHGRIAAVIARLSPNRFQACSCGWMGSVAGATNGELVAVDCKTARVIGAAATMRCTWSVPGAAATAWC